MTIPCLSSHPLRASPGLTKSSKHKYPSSGQCWDQTQASCIASLSSTSWSLAYLSSWPCLWKRYADQMHTRCSLCASVDLHLSCTNLRYSPIPWLFSVQTFSFAFTMPFYAVVAARTAKRNPPTPIKSHQIKALAPAIFFGYVSLQSNKRSPLMCP